MENEKVTHAPKAVIDELDNAREEVVAKSLFAVEIISCLVNEEGDYPHAEQWFDSDSKPSEQDVYMRVY